MKALLLREEKREFGTWLVITKYYDNDDIYIELRDAETKEVFAYIETEEPEESRFDINLN